MKTSDIIYGKYAVLTAYRSDQTRFKNQIANRNLYRELKDAGYRVERSRGYYVHEKTGERVYEPGFIVHDILPEKALYYGEKYKQESIFYKNGKNAALYYTDSANLGKTMLSFTHVIIGPDALKEQFYTKPAYGEPFSFTVKE